jgi:phage-related protein
MAREWLVPGEKPLYWVGSAKRDLLNFPDAVRGYVGIALRVAQFGGKHAAVKPWKLLRITRVTHGELFTRFVLKRLFMYCAFQKKAAKGTKTAQSDIRLISERLRQARKDYEGRHSYTEE